VDGIIVSNHSGRQLDHAATPLDVLPAISAEAGSMTVMIDSGFHRGTDVLTGLGLGASLALVGRPFLFAAALAGEAGVEHAISLLAHEIDTDMALLGLHRLAELDRNMLINPRSPPALAATPSR
jgi:L-lactate dehydrogenase (cytochrome)